MRGSIQLQLEEHCSLYRIGGIRGNLPKAESAVELERSFHRREGIQAHAPVSRLGGLMDDSFGEQSAHAVTPVRRTNIEPLHLAGIPIERP
jgi:hypothetical protein